MSHASQFTVLSQLRDHMRAQGLDYYLVPSSDAHQSEYVPECWQRRVFLTGFTGSMGSAIVGLEEAALWADSRYWIQGEQELKDGPFAFMRQGDEGVLNIPEYLAARAASKPIVVGYDAALHTPNEAKALREALKGCELRPIANLVDAVWSERPALPSAPIEPWPLAFAGLSLSDKLSKLQASLAAARADHVIIATLDELAWAFDLRGADVDFNPVFIGWGLVSKGKAQLFVEPSKLTEAAHAHLAAASVDVAPYEAFESVLQSLKGRVIVDPDNSNQRILDVLALGEAEAVLTRSPVQLQRACKTEAEREGMRRAHLRDGVAVVRFLAWLEEAIASGEAHDEVSIADTLEAFRAEGEHFRGLSFDTISGYGPNGAIVHYRASKESARAIGSDSILLLDSGAQYHDGTTDITRTIHLGTPSALEREHYTRVLRGHLALGRAIFPQGVTGTHLDAFARAPLWEVELNFGHGTGHGVGCYLSVHQGPQRISPGLNDVALREGMVLSNEPGLYFAGKYGIRIENLILVQTKGKGDFGTFLHFEDLTLVPYCRALLEPALLSADERKQVNDYHSRVRAALLPLLDDGTHPDAARARTFLLRETEALFAS